MSEEQFRGTISNVLNLNWKRKVQVCEI